MASHGRSRRQLSTRNDHSRTAEIGGGAVIDAIIEGLHHASQFLCDDGYDKHENPIHIIDQAATELTRLRDLVAAKDEALRVFASDKSWKFDRCPVWEEDHDDQWVWDDPWIDQGDKWPDGSVRTQPVTEPFSFAKAALDKE